MCVCVCASRVSGTPRRTAWTPKTEMTTMNDFFMKIYWSLVRPPPTEKKNDDDMSWSGTCDVRTESVGEKEEKKKILRKQIFGLKYMNELSIC